MSTPVTALDAIVEELQQATKMLITTHENPDGDALGSLLSFDEMMRALGKNTYMFMSASNFPLPHEYQHLPLEDVHNEPPADMDERIAVFLDCGNIDRMPVDFLQRDGQHIVGQEARAARVRPSQIRTGRRGCRGARRVPRDDAPSHPH